MNILTALNLLWFWILALKSATYLDSCAVDQCLLFLTVSTCDCLCVIVWALPSICILHLYLLLSHISTVNYILVSTYAFHYPLASSQIMTCILLSLDLFLLQFAVFEVWTYAYNENQNFSSLFSCRTVSSYYSILYLCPFVFFIKNSSWYIKFCCPNSKVPLHVTLVLRYVNGKKGLRLWRLNRKRSIEPQSSYWKFWWT